MRLRLKLGRFTVTPMNFPQVVVVVVEVVEVVEDGLHLFVEDTTYSTNSWG